MKRSDIRGAEWRLLLPGAASRLAARAEPCDSKRVQRPDHWRVSSTSCRASGEPVFSSARSSSTGPCRDGRRAPPRPTGRAHC